MYIKVLYYYEKRKEKREFIHTSKLWNCTHTTHNLSTCTLVNSNNCDFNLYLALKEGVFELIHAPKFTKLGGGEAEGLHLVFEGKAFLQAQEEMMLQERHHRYLQCSRDLVAPEFIHKINFTWNYINELQNMCHTCNNNISNKKKLEFTQKPNFASLLLWFSILVSSAVFRVTLQIA